MTWQTGARVTRATNPDTKPERGIVLYSNRSMTAVIWDAGYTTTIPSGWLR